MRIFFPKSKGGHIEHGVDKLIVRQIDFTGSIFVQIRKHTGQHVQIDANVQKVVKYDSLFQILVAKSFGQKRVHFVRKSISFRIDETQIEWVSLRQLNYERKSSIHTDCGEQFVQFELVDSSGLIDVERLERFHPHVHERPQLGEFVEIDRVIAFRVEHGHHQTTRFNVKRFVGSVAESTLKFNCSDLTCNQLQLIKIQLV